MIYRYDGQHVAPAAAMTPDESSRGVTFEDPPVGEVAFAVQLREPSIDLEVLGKLAARVRSDYPLREEQVPLPRMVESFGPPPSMQPVIEFFPQPQIPRFWFVSADGNRVVQAQADRFAFNWRRMGEQGDEYPRYKALMPMARRHIEDLYADVTVNAPSAAFDVVELAYVNVLINEETMAPPVLSDFLRTVRALDDAEFLPGAEDTRLQARWVIRRGDAPIGRLYALAEPAFRNSDQRPMYLLTMTARMTSEGTGVDGAMDLFDVGHEWITRGFKDLTTPAMHARWRLDEEDA